MSKNRNRHRGRGHGDTFVVADIVPTAVDGTTTIKVGVSPPPDYIFKNRKNRIAPAQSVWGVGSVTYAPMQVDESLMYINGEGNFVYYYGCPFPSKTIAPPEAIYAAAGAKRLAMNGARFLASKDAIIPLISIVFIGKKRRARLLTNALYQFNGVADMMLTPYYLEDGYYCKFAKQVRKFVETFLSSFGVESGVAVKTAEIVACFFEYDNAYRYRPQDLAGETSKHALIEDLPSELARLIEIQDKRETPPEGGASVAGRSREIAKIVKYFWYIPSIREALREAIEAVDLEQCVMDEADIYHTLLYGDYRVKGRTLEECFKVLEGYHGVDQNAWPPRIMIRQTQ